MNKLLYIVLFSTLVIASEHPETDIIQRSVNFVIFMVILYKIAYKPLSALLRGRTKDIQSELEALDSEIEEIKEDREKAILSIENAKIKAKDVKKSISAEAKNITARIENETKIELISLEKSYSDKEEIEEKRFTTSIVKEITDEIFADESIIPTNDEISDVIIKKVG